MDGMEYPDEFQVEEWDQEDPIDLESLREYLDSPPIRRDYE